MSQKLFQNLLNIRDSLTIDNSQCYVYLLTRENRRYNGDGNNDNDNDDDNDNIVLMKSPHIPFYGKFPHLLVTKYDNKEVLSYGLDYLLESETLSNGSTLNRLFSRLESEEKNITKMIENRNTIIESIVRIAGKGPFKTKDNTIMIIEKNGKKFIRKIDKRAREITKDIQ